MRDPLTRARLVFGAVVSSVIAIYLAQIDVKEFIEGNIGSARSWHVAIEIGILAGLATWLAVRWWRAVAKPGEAAHFLRLTSREVDTTPLSRSAKAVSLAFLIIWGAAIVVILNPILHKTVGSWFAWWLVIVPSIEFDCALKRHASDQRQGAREICG